MYNCDNCFDEVEVVYIDLSTGLNLCADCYFSDDNIDNDDDFDDE
jgi:hypothetical protein